MLIQKKKLSLFALPLIAAPWALHAADSDTLVRRPEVHAVNRRGSNADLMLRGRAPAPAPVVDVGRLSVVRLAVDDQVARMREREAERAAAQAAAAERAKAVADAQRTSRSSQSGMGGWRQLLAQYPWNVDVAYRVMMCESRGDPGAVNPNSGATGLFQILKGPSDPVSNVALAYDMYSHRGWQPWASSRFCWG